MRVVSPEGAISILILAASQERAAWVQRDMELSKVANTFSIVAGREAVTKILLDAPPWPFPDLVCKEAELIDVLDDLPPVSRGRATPVIVFGYRGPASWTSSPGAAANPEPLTARSLLYAVGRLKGELGISILTLSEPAAPGTEQLMVPDR